MDDMDTTPGASGDAGDQIDWSGKYNGLQRVLGKRTEELTTAQQEVERWKQTAVEHEAELESYRAAARADAEEAEAESQYEALKTRFDGGPPTPRSNNPIREPRAQKTYEVDPFARPRSPGFPT